MPDPDDEFDDEFTSLHSARFDRVDLVHSPANGSTGFLVMKQAADSPGLLPPELVRDLIAKSEPGPEPSTGEQVTVSGSPAAIAKLIHGAPVRKAAPDEAVVAEATQWIHDAGQGRRAVARHAGQNGEDIAKAVADHMTAAERWAEWLRADAGGDVAKAEQSAKTQNDLPDSAFAYIEPGGKKDESGKTTPRSLRHFNISDAAHVRNALARASQSPFGDKALPKIRAAAKRFDIEVSKESGVPGDTVTKDAATGPDLDEGVDGMDPTVPLADPDEMAPGDPMVPGSPAWESIDAATACKWMSIAARLKNALCTLAERELIEAAVADPSDASDAWDLQDAMCAVDYVIDTLACFAAGEQAGVDLAADTMAMIGKALASFDPGPLETVEGLAPIAKAGRVLSAANEASIRAAHDSLQKVLMSLPQAPAADETVTKEAAVAADQTSTEPAPAAQVTPAAPVAKAEDAAAPGAAIAAGMTAVADSITAELRAAPVAKADGEAPMMVYDGTGKCLGIVDPAGITAVQGAAPAMGTMAAGDADPGDGADAAPAADDATAPADDPCPDPADMTPQPAAEAGVPADEDKVAKQDQADPAATNGTITLDRDELASTIAKAITAALDARAPAEGISKSDAAGVLAVAKSLEERLVIVENSPAAPRVFTNGAVPPPGQLRGQDRAQQGGPTIDVAKAREMKQRMYTADPAEANRIATEMNQSAIASLEAIHRAGPSST